MKADSAMRTVSFDARERLELVPAELQYLWDRRMLLAYARVIAASSVDADGISLRRGLRKTLRSSAPPAWPSAPAAASLRTAALAARTLILAQGRRRRRRRSGCDCGGAGRPALARSATGLLAPS